MANKIREYFCRTSFNPFPCSPVIITRIVNTGLGGAAIYLTVRVATLAIILLQCVCSLTGLKWLENSDQPLSVRSCLVMRILSGAQFRPL